MAKVRFSLTNYSSQSMGGGDQVETQFLGMEEAAVNRAKPEDKEAVRAGLLAAKACSLRTRNSSWTRK